MEQVFNELSVSGSHRNKYNALEALRDACHVAKSLEKIGFEPIIRITQCFSSRELASGYTYNDLVRDKDARQQFQVEYSFMLSRFSKSPYVEELCAVHGMTELEEYRFGQGRCWGLALAHIWGIPAISLAGDQNFIGGFVNLTHDFMDEDTTLHTEKSSVLTLATKADVDQYEKIIRESLRVDFASGQDILDNANLDVENQRFPHLAFCGDAPGQFRVIDNTHPRFRRIVEILYALNEAMRLVQNPEDIFMPIGIYYTSRESDTTSQNDKTRKARTFLCPDGESRFFGEHVRINRNMRIHLFSDKIMRKVYIGHIGEHLQTSRS